MEMTRTGVTGGKETANDIPEPGRASLTRKIVTKNEQENSRTGQVRGWESTQLMWFRGATSANYRGNLGYCYSFSIIKLS